MTDNSIAQMSEVRGNEGWDETYIYRAGKNMVSFDRVAMVSSPPYRQLCQLPSPITMKNQLR